MSGWKRDLELLISHILMGICLTDGMVTINCDVYGRCFLLVVRFF
jgi:hypothetical protein